MFKNNINKGQVLDVLFYEIEGSFLLLLTLDPSHNGL